MNQQELAAEVGALGDKALAAECPHAAVILMTLAGLLCSMNDMVLEVFAMQAEDISRLQLHLIEQAKGR